MGCEVFVRRLANVAYRRLGSAWTWIPIDTRRIVVSLEKYCCAVPCERMIQMQTQQTINLLGDNAAPPAILNKHQVAMSKIIHSLTVPHPP
jgi:hypothetical protein